MTSTSTSTDTAGVEGALPRRLRREIELRTLSRVSDELGVSRESLARYLARLDVHAGTRALIESKVSRLDAPDTCARCNVARCLCDDPGCAGCHHDAPRGSR